MHNHTADRGLSEAAAHHAVVSDEGVAARSDAHALAREVQFNAHLVRERATAVGEHEHAPRILQALGPSVHHKGVIHAHARHRVDPPPPHLCCARHKAWQVLHAAQHVHPSDFDAAWHTLCPCMLQ